MKIVTTTIINDDDDGDDDDDDDDDNDGDDDNDRDNQPKLAFNNNSLGVLGGIRRFSNYCISPSYQIQTILICSVYAYAIHLEMFEKSKQWRHTDKKKRLITN